MSRREKKAYNAMINDKKGHLFFGASKRNLPVILLRPSDLLEFCEFVGANADDILIFLNPIDRCIINLKRILCYF